jgi:hypothetical protein
LIPDFGDSYFEFEIGFSFRGQPAPPGGIAYDDVKDMAGDVFDGIVSVHGEVFIQIIEGMYVCTGHTRPEILERLY